MRNIDAEKQLKEAWNLHYEEEYQSLLNIYKERGYRIKRNDKTGDHIVNKPTDPQNMFIGTPFENIFNFGGK